MDSNVREYSQEEVEFIDVLDGLDFPYIEDYECYKLTERPYLRMRRKKMFNIIKYLVNLIEKETYVLQEKEIILSSYDYLNETKGILHRREHNLVYLTPINKKRLVDDYLETIFTRYDKGKSIESILNDDITKLNINNNNYVILSYYKKDDKPYIVYDGQNIINYDVSVKPSIGNQLKLVDNKFSYIYDFLDFLYGYASISYKYDISNRELKTLALYFASNYMNKESGIKIKSIRG